MFSNVLKLAVMVLSFLILHPVAAKNENNNEDPTTKNLDVKTLFQNDDYRNVSLSPDGKHLGLIRNHNDIPILVIVDTATMKAVNQIYFAKKDRVGSYRWANNERLLIFLSTEKRYHEQKFSYGEIYSINIDEEDGEFIFGVRSLVHRGKFRRNVTEADYEKHLAHPRVLSILEDDPRHIIISTSQYNSKGMWVFKLDIYKGKIETLAQVDGVDIDHDNTYLWYLDKGQGLWQQTIEKNGDISISNYDFSEQEWLNYKIPDVTKKFGIIDYYKDSKQILVRDYCGNDTLSICLFDPETKKLTSLYKVAGSDLDWLYYDDENVPFAVSYFNEYPQYKILDETHPLAKELSGLLKQFAGYQMQVTVNKTGPGKVLIELTSDVQPTVWYVLDRKSKKLSFVANSKKSIDTSALLPQYSFKFNARDNTEVQGYITLPKSTAEAPKPAVILVHGGPHSRDYWGFDSEVQLLAANGYAVVQVNFRGSKGFGWEFEKSGFKQWGQNIQYDIIDGIKHLVSKGYIDKNRLCIMGASFGAYSALQSSIIEPDLFKCAIASSGVYDLELLIDDAEYKDARNLARRVGSTDIQIAHSPIYGIEKLEVPLLLAHGTKDDRTPLEQAEALMGQLDEHNKVYHWYEFKNEGHGLFNSENRLKFYKQILLFLEENNPVNP